MTYDLSFIFIRVLLNVKNIFSYENVGLTFAKVSTTLYTQNDCIKSSVKCKHHGRKYDFLFLSGGLALPLTIRDVKL